MARKDVHRPSAIEPADYEFVGIECMRLDDLGAIEALRIERERIQAHMRSTGGTYAHVDTTGNCMVCGNVLAIYTALFHHAPSNTYVRAGADCTEKLWSGHAAGFRRIMDAVTAAREAKAGKLKARQLLQEAGLVKAWEIYTQWTTMQNTERDAWPYEEVTIAGIVSKLIRYGSISEAQERFMRGLLDRIPQRAEREAKRAAEREAAHPVPEGKLQALVDVVSVKDQESDYARGGYRRVMTVKAIDSGWLAWGTCPPGVSKGDRIMLSATFSRSDRDEKFGFFKRPRVLSRDEISA